jgi:hypothetical protein
MSFTKRTQVSLFASLPSPMSLDSESNFIVDNNVVLTGNANYHEWAWDIEATAMLGVCWRAFIGTNNPIDGSAAQEQRVIQREMVAVGLIMKTVDPAIALHLRSLPGVTETDGTTRRPNAQELWDHLKSRYEKSDPITGLRYFGQLVRTEFVDDGTLEDQINKLTMLRFRCTVNGYELSDHQFAATLLVSLPESYSHFIECLLANRRLQDFTVEEVRAKILQAESMRKYSADRAASDEHPRAAPTPRSKKGPKVACFKCGTRGHHGSRCHKI